MKIFNLLFLASFGFADSQTPAQDFLVQREVKNCIGVAYLRNFAMSDDPAQSIFPNFGGLIAASSININDAQKNNAFKIKFGTMVLALFGKTNMQSLAVTGLVSTNLMFGVEKNIFTLFIGLGLDYTNLKTLNIYFAVPLIMRLDIAITKEIILILFVKRSIYSFDTEAVWATGFGISYNILN